MSARHSPLRDDGRLHQRLVKLVQETAELPMRAADVTPATSLLGRGIGLDSIEVLALVSAIEAEFDVTIPDDQLKREHFATLGALASFVEGFLR